MEFLIYTIMNRVYPISAHYGNERTISRVFRWQCTTRRQWLDKTSKSLLFTAERLLYARRLIDIILKDHGNSKMCEKTPKGLGRIYRRRSGVLIEAWSCRWWNCWRDRKHKMDRELVPHLRLRSNECEYHRLQILIIVPDLNCWSNFNHLLPPHRRHPGRP